MRLTALAAALLLVAAPAARADEGMWTLDNLPLSQLQERYHFAPPAGWVDHVRLGCVRFNDGGSGSFVSPNGLVITNHHVALGQLQKMSSAGQDYVLNGFFARTPAEEVRCADLELDQLVAMVDVTAQVRGAIDGRASAAQRNAQRKAEIARIQQESQQKTGLRSDVVELYAGGEYWLYRYHKYTDVRLVMAPEVQAANFGGDPDNFCYPRHAYDVAFVRVYDGGKPVDSSAFYFPFSTGGTSDGDLVFVAGHPGSTSRLNTIAQLEFQRDVLQPDILAVRRSRLNVLRTYGRRGPEQQRRATEEILYLENSIKARNGIVEGLRDPNWMRQMAASESTFRAQVTGEARLNSIAGGAWERIAGAVRQDAAQYARRLHYGQAFSEPSRLIDLAEKIVRYTAEVPKPNELRLEEYRDSELESLRFNLFSPAPVYADLEEVVIANELESARAALPAGDPWLRAALGGRLPGEVAHTLVTGTHLVEVAARKKLIAGGAKAVAASEDPLIVWARGLDGPYREVRAAYEDNVQSVEAQEGNRLAQARFAAFGRSTYPDATFTLRLSYGKVAGYEAGTTWLPWKTNFASLYARSSCFDGQPPFDLAPAFAAHQKDVDPGVPLNVVSTPDIIGGSSGSPVLDRDLHFTGIIFDGNIESLVLDFAFTEERARAISVDSRGILEGLRKVYGMDGLAEELVGKGK